MQLQQAGGNQSVVALSRSPAPAGIGPLASPDGKNPDPSLPASTGAGGSVTQGVASATVAPAAPAAPAPAAPAPAPAAPAATVVVTAPNTLWYFDGENPAGYATSAPVHTDKNTGTFAWTCSASLRLSSPTAARPTVTAIQASVAANDAWVEVTWSDPAGGTATQRQTLTVKAPSSMTHLNDVDKVDATWAYETEIHYSVKDQFGAILPSNVPLNEQFTAAPTADAAGMDWRRGPEGGALVNPNDWFDRVQGETATHTPTPVGPSHADKGTAVYHWPGHWQVGSQTIGRGRRVISVTWQKYRGYARHT